MPRLIRPPRESPYDILADIGLVPEIWNARTDPGGDGEPSGREDAVVDSSDDDDYTERCDHCGPDADYCQECHDGGICNNCGRSL